MPKVSVITATYNRSRLLDRAIRSVLAQSYKDYEMIIVDDNSTDNTEAVVSSWLDNRIVYVKLEQNTKGSIVPRETGLRVARGVYIAILDDDDYWINTNKLHLQVSYLNNNPDCLLVGTNALAFSLGNDVALRIKYPTKDKLIRERMLIQNCFFHSSVMYRRDKVFDVGGYGHIKNGFYSNSCNDYDLWCRMGLAGKMANIPIYGVGCIYQTNNIPLRTRLGLLKLYLHTIRTYKNCYPNYKKGLLAHITANLFEIYPLSIFKGRLRRFRL